MYSYKTKKNFTGFYTEVKAFIYAQQGQITKQTATRKINSTEQKTKEPRH